MTVVLQCIHLSKSLTEGWTVTGISLQKQSHFSTVFDYYNYVTSLT